MNGGFACRKPRWCVRLGGVAGLYFPDVMKCRMHKLILRARVGVRMRVCLCMFVHALHRNKLSSRQRKRPNGKNLGYGGQGVRAHVRLGTQQPGGCRCSTPYLSFSLFRVCRFCPPFSAEIPPSRRSHISAASSLPCVGISLAVRAQMVH